MEERLATINKPLSQSEVIDELKHLDIGSRKDNAAEIPLREKKKGASRPLLTEADMPSPIWEPAPEPEDEG